MTSHIEISKRLVFVNATSSVLRKILSLGVLVWLQQYLVRRIGPEEYSLLPILAALMIFFPILTTMFVSGLRRFVTDAYARGDERGVTGLVSTMVPLLSGVALLFAAVGGVAAWFIDHLLEIPPELVRDARIMFALLILGATLRVAFSPLSLGFDLRQRFLLRNLIGLGAELLKTVLLVALLFVSTRVLWVVVANTAAAVIEVLLVTRVSCRLVPALRYRRGLFRRETARPLLGFGGWSVLSQLAFMVREAADPLILNRLAGAVAVTSFHLGSMVDRHVRTMFLQGAATVQPVVTAMNATDQHDRLRRTYLRLSRYSLWILLGLATPIVVFRVELFALYLRETYATYAPAALVTALLLGRAFVIFPNSALGMVTVAKAEVKAIATRNCALSAANLALTLYLVGVRDMGAVGSALGTFCVTIVGAPLLNWTLGLRLSGASAGAWFGQTVGPGLIPFLIACPVWILWQRLASPQSWVALCAAFAAGALVYALALFFLALQENERRELLQALGRLRARLKKRSA